jgi:hypothetical protein
MVQVGSIRPAPMVSVPVLSQMGALKGDQKAVLASWCFPLVGILVSASGMLGQVQVFWPG